MSVWALLMAAGSGERMGPGRNKVLAHLCGKPVLLRSAEAFETAVDGMVVVVQPRDEAEARALLPAARFAHGSATRQQSVLAGLRALPEDADVVLVHDAARPLVSREVIRRCIAAVRAHGSGVASVPVKDTIKRCAPDGTVLETPPRAALRAAQTPQAFHPAQLRRAIEALEAQGVQATDDAAAMEAAGHPVFLVEGDPRNLKLTTPEDMTMAAALAGQEEGSMRVGHGYDAHRLTEGRALVLCGVEIPHEKGLLGHSDADVALHALMDALLGAASMGDIGRRFPDSQEQYRGISSVTLLETVAAELAQAGYTVENVDVTILAQRPKLQPYMAEMTARTAQALGICPRRVSVKATTTEGMGFEGAGEGISAHAVALLRTGG